MPHLYLHVPFCVRRCSYCDFSIAVRKRIPAREYVEAVLGEVALLGLTDPGREPGDTEGHGLDPGRKPGDTEEHGLDTLYLGGGTPSLLPADAVSTLLTSLRDAFDVTSLRDAIEVTLEANPEDVTPELASAWRRAGVNRVSLGAQSFDDNVLTWMHRSHDAARIGAAVHALRGAGIENVSLDLIFALPAELQRNWERDLELALSLDPDHLSLYGLTVEERTPLARWISRGAVVPPDDDRYAEEYLLAHVRLAASGYRFYEVSNACRDQRRQLRRPRASLEPRRLAGVRPRSRGGALPGRVPRGPDARTTGTGARLLSAAHRCRIARHGPPPPAAATARESFRALHRPLVRAGLGGAEGRAPGVHSPGLASARFPGARLDRGGSSGLNC